ncbi:MAG: hypothetical protein OHK0024_24290 [Thalassobaculales bacterium]
MSVGDVWWAHLRLALLRTLAADPGCASNESLLTDEARAVGIQATRDQVRAGLAWLAEQGLVTVQSPELGSGRALMVATMTARGLDVSEGRAGVPGVARPLPRG